MPSLFSRRLSSLFSRLQRQHEARERATEGGRNGPTTARPQLPPPAPLLRRPTRKPLIFFFTSRPILLLRRPPSSWDCGDGEGKRESSFSPPPFSSPRVVCVLSALRVELDLNLPSCERTCLADRGWEIGSEIQQTPPPRPVSILMLQACARKNGPFLRISAERWVFFVDYLPGRRMKYGPLR